MHVVPSAWNILSYLLYLVRASLMAHIVKNLPAMQEIQVGSLDQEDALEEAWQPTAVFLPEESHGQRSLAGYSPRGHQWSDRTERLTLSLSQ